MKSYNLNHDKATINIAKYLFDLIKLKAIDLDLLPTDL